MVPLKPPLFFHFTLPLTANFQKREGEESQPQGRGRGVKAADSVIPQSRYRGREEIGGVCVPTLSARAYTATLYVMVNIVKGDGRAPATLTSLG